MKIKRTVIVVLLIIGCLGLFADIPGEEKVKNMLEEVDEWVISDSSRIKNYIKQENKRTMQKLKSSEHWDPIKKDLAFLLNIDYVGSSDIDNTGRLYYQMRLTGETAHLFYADEPMNFPIQLSPNNWSEKGITISSYLVHPSGDYILALVMKHGNELYDIYRFDRDGKFRPLIENDRIEYTAPTFKNKDEFIFLINDHRDQYLSLYSQKEQTVDTIYTEEESFWPLDYRDGKILCVRWYSFSESQLFVVDEKSGKSKDITERGYFLGGVFTSTGEILTLTTAISSKSGYPVFALVDMNGDYELVYEPDKEVDDYDFVRGEDLVVATLNTRGYSELTAFDLNGNKKTVPDVEMGVISGIAANDSGEVVFDYSSPQTPPTPYHFKIGEEEKDEIARISTFGFDFSNIDVELIKYPSTDGTMIPSFIYIPDEAKKDGTNPAMIVYHGGPPSQSRPYFQRNIAFALSRGLIVMFPNVRGSEGYGPEWERADNGEGRFQALEDAKSAIDYLVEENWCTRDRIAIKGGSYGGYTVNYLAVKYPESFACAVSEVGVADVDYELTHGDMTFQEGWEIEYGPIGSELTHKLSPIFYSTHLERPMLITTGSHDPRVVAGGVRRFAWVLQELGKDILYYEETKAGHGSVTKSQLIEDFTRSYTFIFEHVMK